MIYKNILLVGCIWHRKCFQVGCIFVLVLMAQKLFLKSYMSGGLCCYFVISSFFTIVHKKGKIMESSSLLTRNIFPVLDFWFLRQHAGECGYWVAASWLWRTSKNSLWALLCTRSGPVFYYEAQITWSSCELFLSRLSHLCESQRCNHSLRREKRGFKKREFWPPQPEKELRVLHVDTCVQPLSVTEPIIFLCTQRGFSQTLCTFLCLFPNSLVV